MPGFQSFFSFFGSFCFGKIRVKIFVKKTMGPNINIWRITAHSYRITQQI